MNNQLDQVQLLLNKKKYTKALSILKKVNKKQPTFQSLNFTALSYFLDQKYAQANLYYLKALKLALEANQKLEVLGNLALTEIHLDNPDKAIKCYIDSLKINDSIATARQRSELCNIAADQNNHKIVFEYAPKLLAFLEYAHYGLYLLIQSHLLAQQLSTELTSDNDKGLDYYLKKLQGEIATFDSNQAKRLFELVLSSNNQTYINELAVVVEKKFAHENWFKQFKSQPVQKKQNQKDKSSSKNIPAQRVVGDNSEQTKLVEQLLIHCESIGAYFHPSLKIFIENDALSVKVFEQTDETKKLISIPYCGLPIRADYQFTLDNNDELQISTIENPINPTAIKTMMLLGQIYNSTNKFAQWKKEFPFIVLSHHPDLLAKLCAAKPITNKAHKYMHMLQQKQLADMVLESFFGSREMLIQQKELKKYGIITDNEKEAGLLSVIDFLNHKTKSGQYQLIKGSVNIKGPACQTSNELFVQYNYYDPLVTYLLYGFIDIQAPHVYSTPIKLSMTNGKVINVLGCTAKANEQSIPDELKRLADYIPQISDEHKGSVEITKLMIPNTDESELLREVLEVVINTINGEQATLTADTLHQEILHLEKQVINNNLAYWQQVQTMLNNITANQSDKSALLQVQQLVDFFKKHLLDYCAKCGITLF